MRLLALLVLLGCGAAPGPTAGEGSALPAEVAPAEEVAPAPSAPSGGLLTVEVLDIGQGDAILLRTPGGKTVLIDAGTGNKGEAALPLLEARGVKNLDLVVATHPHSDHVGGLDEVLNSLPARLLIDNGLPHTTDTYDRLMKIVEDKKIPYKPAKVGQKYKLDSGVQLEVLAPGATPITGTRSDLNANSVVVRATYGRACFLFTGDAEAETETALLANKIAPCAILKIAHHGSLYASSDEFLAAVHPTIALISVGAGNDYGHPSPETLTRLDAVGASVYRTDLLGTLKIETDGQTATLSSDRGQPRSVEIGGAATTANAPDAEIRLDLNKATAAELEALPGIGASLAAEIIAYRKQKGRFSSVDQLDEVPGIGDATLAKLRPLVEVGR